MKEINIGQATALTSPDFCNIEKMVADDTRDALFAWDGYTEVAPAQEK